METNTLTLVNDGKSLEVKGFDGFKKRVADLQGVITINTPTLENVAICEKTVTNSRKELKEYEKEVEDVTSLYNKPLEKALAPYKDVLGSFKESLSDYQAKVLEFKKEDYKNKAKPLFEQLASLSSTDGEIPDWGTFYEPSWYGKTKEVLTTLIVSKLKRSDTTNNDKAITLLQIKGSANIAQAKKLLNDNHIAFEEM